MRRLELLDPQTIGVSFPYNQRLVEHIKHLSQRRWNAGQRRWEVHISHFPELLK